MKVRSLAAAGLLALAVAGCSDGERPVEGDASPAGSQAPTSTSTSQVGSGNRSPISYPPVPTALPGQIAYARFAAGESASVHLVAARSDRTYAVEGVCRPEDDAVPPAPVAYEVRSASGKVLTGGEIGCGGTVKHDTALVSWSGVVTLSLTGPFAGVREVFAAIVPE